MNNTSYKTLSQRKEDVNKEWLLVDANDMILGRLAAKVAYLLRGKHKPSFTPHVDGGDHIVVINADKVKLSGLKAEQKTYIHHTGYPGGQRETSFEDMMKKDSRRVIEKAVKGMIPRNNLGRQIFKNLHVYSGAEHAHQGQNPKAINLNDFIK